MTSPHRSRACGPAIADLQPETAVIPLLREWHAHGGSAQGGVAADRTTAELAAYTAAPGSLRRIRPGRSVAFLRCVPLAVLQKAGIPARTIQRLGWFGWGPVVDLLALTRRQLVVQFAEGELLYRYAQANDVRPVATYQPPPPIRVHFAFEQSVREPGEIEPVLRRLVEQAWQQLERRSPGSLAIGLEAVLPRAEVVSAIELQLGSLTATQPAQGHLFAPARPPVEKALRAVEHRYPGLLRRIVLRDRHAYLPEEAYRLEPITLSTPDQARSARKVKSVTGTRTTTKARTTAGSRA